MERISEGDLTEKEIFEIYTKNYKPELEYHEIFTKCISHVYTQKKKTNSSMLSKIFFGFEKIVSNPNKLQIPEMGLKVDCEVYLTKVLSNDYRDNKTNEKNPMNEKINELKQKIQNLNERYDNLAVQSLLQRNENKIKKSSEKNKDITINKSSKIITTGGKRIITGGSSSSSSSTTSSTTVINGGSSSSSSTSSTTIDINSLPTYTTTDGEVDISSFNRIISQMKVLLQASSEKYSSLEIQHEKTLKELVSIKAEFNSGKDKECDCDKNLKTCQYTLIQKNNEITRLENIIIELKTKITLCQNNPPTGNCDKLKEELKN
jgi:chromosome segregation ATPase